MKCVLHIGNGNIKILMAIKRQKKQELTLALKKILFQISKLGDKNFYS